MKKIVPFLVLATGSSDKTVKIWSLDGQLLYTISHHSKALLDVKFNNNGEYIYSCSEDSTIAQFNAVDGSLVYTYAGHNSCVYSIALTTDVTRLVSCSDDESIKVWNT